MDMSKYNSTGGGGDDLKAKDFVGKNLRLTISKVEVVTYPATEKQAEQIKPALYFEGKEKRLILNGTNNETLCHAYGTDSEGWINKSIGLTTKDYSAEGFGYGWIVTALDAEYESDIPF